MKALTALLHEDATLSMPPYDLWLRGHDDIVGWMLGVGSVCRGSRLIPTVANGTPAFAHYHPAEDGDGHVPWALMVIEIVDGRIVGINSFLDTQRWFPLFDLPSRLEKGVSLRRSLVIGWALLVVAGYGATVWLGEPKEVSSPTEPTRSPRPSLDAGDGPARDPSCPPPTPSPRPDGPAALYVCLYTDSR